MIYSSDHSSSTVVSNILPVGNSFLVNAQLFARTPNNNETVSIESRQSTIESGERTIVEETSCFSFASRKYSTLVLSEKRNRSKPTSPT